MPRSSDFHFTEQDRIDLDRRVSKAAEQEPFRRQRIAVIPRNGTEHNEAVRERLAQLFPAMAWRPGDES